MYIFYILYPPPTAIIEIAAEQKQFNLHNLRQATHIHSNCWISHGWIHLLYFHIYLTNITL